MLFFKEYSFLRILNKKLISLAILMALSICVLQIDSLTGILIPSQKISLSGTTTPAHDSHIPQVCSLVGQKYTNQTKNIADFLIPQNQGDIPFYNSEKIVSRVLKFQTLWNGKLYIKNLTLLV